MHERGKVCHHARQAQAQRRVGAGRVDVPISCHDESGFWEQLAEWTARRVAAYPPEIWLCETVVADQPGRGSP